MIRYLLPILLLAGCATSKVSGPKPEPSASPDPSASVTPTPDPSSSPRPKVTLVCNSTCTEHEREKVAKAEAVINAWKDQPCVADQLRSVTLVQTGNRTTAQVIEHVANFDATVTVRYYRDNSSDAPIGYRNKGSTTINLNRKFHSTKKYDNEWVTASNILHETAHVEGYTHDSARTTRRPRSVPYQMNRVVERCEKVAKALLVWLGLSAPACDLQGQGWEEAV